MNTTKNWILFLFFSTVLCVYLVVKPKDIAEDTRQGIKTAQLESPLIVKENQTHLARSLK